MAAPLYAVAAGGNFSNANTWSTASGGAGGDGPPAIGQDANLDSASGDVVLDADSAAGLLSLDMSGYTGTLSSDGAWTIDVDGDVTLGGTLAAGANSILIQSSGDIDVDTGNLTVTGDVTVEHNDIAANARTVRTRTLCGDIKFIVNNNGITSFTALDKGYWKTFTLTAGKYDGGNFGIEVGGDIIRTAGVWTNSGTVNQTADGNLKNTDFNYSWAVLQEDAVGTPTGNIYTDSISGSGSIAASAHVIYFHQITTDNFWTLGGTCGTEAFVSAASSVSSGGSITLVDKKLTLRGAAAVTMTMDGGIVLGTGAMDVEAYVAGLFTLDMNGYSIDSPDTDIEEGDAAAANELGKILFRNAYHRFKSLKRANAGAVGNGADLANGFFDISGTFDGAGITVVADDARIRSATVQNVDCTGRAWAFAGSTDGGGNGGDLIFRPKPEGIGMGVAA